VLTLKTPENRATFVQTPCGSGYVSSCTGNPYQGTLGCTCTAEQSGTNCTAQGLVAIIGKPCCSGLTQEARSGVCLAPTTPAFSNPQGVFCGDDVTKVSTAIGCLPTDFGGLVGVLLKFGMGIAGGIAFLLILLGGFQILTSAGNPEQLNAGKELVGSAVTGLLLIIFSVFFLKIIGVDILGIPQWR
jgi:hypothetical protein